MEGSDQEYTHTTPWRFSNVDDELNSISNNGRIKYQNIGEMAMGSPLAGTSFWVDSSGTEIKLNDWSGGPAMWDKEGVKVAIPFWTRKFFRGTVQQLAVLDTSERSLTIFKRVFRVIHLQSFDRNHIKGIDSPIYRTKIFDFDITKEPSFRKRYF